MAAVYYKKLIYEEYASKISDDSAEVTWDTGKLGDKNKVYIWILENTR